MIHTVGNSVGGNRPRIIIPKALSFTVLLLLIEVDDDDADEGTTVVPVFGFMVDVVDDDDK